MEERGGGEVEHLAILPALGLKRSGDALRPAELTSRGEGGSSSLDLLSLLLLGVLSESLVILVLGIR